VAVEDSPATSSTPTTGRRRCSTTCSRPAATASTSSWTSGASCAKKTFKRPWYGGNRSWTTRRVRGLTQHWRRCGHAVPSTAQSLVSDGGSKAAVGAGKGRGGKGGKGGAGKGAARTSAVLVTTSSTASSWRVRALSLRRGVLDRAERHLQAGQDDHGAQLPAGDHLCL